MEYAAIIEETSEICLKKPDSGHRKYLFLTLGSVFFFACVYYIVQKIPGTGQQWQEKKEDDSNDYNYVSKKQELKKNIDIYEDNAMYDATLNVPEGELSFASCLLFSLVTNHNETPAIAIIKVADSAL